MQNEMEQLGHVMPLLRGYILSCFLEAVKVFGKDNFAINLKL